MDGLTAGREAQMQWAKGTDCSLGVCLAEIERLRGELSARDRQLAELRAACEPFVAYLRHLDEYKHPDEMGVGYYLHPNVTCGDFRKLAALLPTDPNAKGSQ